MLSFSLAKDALKPLAGKLLEIRKTRTTELQRLSDGFGDPYELAKFYVPPECQHFPPADENEEESTATLRQPVLQLIDNYLSGPKTHSRRHMFVLSDAGMGKTSLLVILKLAHLTSFWPPEYNCELLKLGEKSLNDIAEIKDQSNTVLLLDALDEDPLAWGRVELRVAQLLKTTQTFRRTLITCRTQFFNVGEAPYSSRGQIEVSGFDCPVIYNSLFSNSQCLEYLERKSTQHLDDPKWLEKASKIAHGMGSLKMRPMLLAHIDDLMEEDALQWSEYQLYSILIKNWLKREQRKILNETENYPSIEDLLRACRNLAIHLHANRLRHASQREINELIQDTPETRNIEFMHFGGRSLLNRDSRGNYRFSHYSIQEFLVVNAILEGVVPVRNLLVHATDFMLRLFTLWRVNATPEQFKAARLDALSLRSARFAGQSLVGVDFSKMDLEDADFSGADLSEANFTESNLTNVNLSGANIERAIFRGANLKSARLESVKGTGAQMQWAILSAANFSAANLFKANLNFAKLNGVIYNSQTRWPLSVDPIREGAILFSA